VNVETTEMEQDTEAEKSHVVSYWYQHSIEYLCTISI